MNFKGHIVAGTTVGLCTGFIATAFGDTTLSLLLQIIGITICFSLLPDLDTSSIPQRWFFRFIFVLLIYLAINHKYQAATLVSICSITPLLSPHRGWTHSIWSAILIPIGFILAYNFLTSSTGGYTKFFFLNNILSILKANMWIIIAATLGWLTHLFADSKLAKKV